MPFTLKELDTDGLVIHSHKVTRMLAERVRSINSNTVGIVYLAYLYYKLLESDDNGLNSALPVEELASNQYEALMSGKFDIPALILGAVRNYCPKEMFIRAYDVYRSVGNNPDIFAAVIVNFDEYFESTQGRYGSEYTTPSSIIKLAQSILDIKETDSVADVCCGYGKFLTRTSDIVPNAQYSGYEMNIHCASVLLMKSEVLGSKFEVTLGDVLLTLGSDKNKEFDKIFSNYPFMVFLQSLDEISKDIPFKCRRNAGDWVFNKLITDHISETGKAVTISPVGITWNTLDKDARKYFVDNGLIESIIFLPSGIFSSTGIQTAIFVFSKNNTNIKLINAENIFTKDTLLRKNTLSQENINEILNLLNHDSEHSILISNDQIEKNEYDLSFRRYSSTLPKFQNGVELSSISSIIRGSVDPKAVVENQKSDNFLLKLSDLSDGIISSEIPDSQRVDLPDPSVQPLAPYDIVISRFVSPIKVAIMSPDDNRKIFPGGNMFVVRVNRDRINPYFLLSYLLSDNGQESLNHIATGSVLRALSAKSLNSLEIPLEDPDTQRRVSENIVAAMTQLNIYKLKVESAKDKISNSFYIEEN